MKWNQTLHDNQHWMRHSAAKLSSLLNGRPAITNPWSSYQVCNAVTQNNTAQNRIGIGFVFTETDDLAGINVDSRQLTPMVSPYTSYLDSTHQRLQKNDTQYVVQKVFN